MFISLIPKVKSGSQLQPIRQIILCNVCYKMISKIIVKRLRLLLNRMIDESHVAFVPNRSITENVVLT